MSSGGLRVGYQGEPGSYSEAALRQLFAKTENVVPTPFSSFEAVFQAVQKGEIERGLLPFENTLGGSIHQNYDLALTHDLHVIGELQFRVRHNLIALPGTKIEDVKTVMSHPQALAQCDAYIRRHGFEREASYDTAGSVKMIADGQLANTAAIASELAAELYGMEILDHSIEDEGANYTRFLLLASEPRVPTEDVPTKTSVVFALRGEPGVLFKALSVFALRDIDLTKIESRPGHQRILNTHNTSTNNNSATHDATGSPMKKPKPAGTSLDAPTLTVASTYTAAPVAPVFYIDFVANVTEERTENALRHLREIAPFVRVLGSYPIAGEEPTAGFDIPGPAVQRPRAASRVRLRGLSIGIVGFGTFGQFLARAFIEQGHTVIGTSRSDYSAEAAAMGALFTTDLDLFVKEAADVIIFSVSVLSFESVLKAFPFGSDSVLVVDVLSVKSHAKNLLLQYAPPNVDIVCTHPMFGPESGKYSWDNLPMVYEKVRVTDYHRTARYLSIFEDKGCRLVQMSCEEHDEHAAGSQFLTHLVGRVLASVDVTSTPINTKGFERLLQLVENTCKDSFDLFKALYLHNPNSSEQLTNLENALAGIRAQLVRSLDADDDVITFSPRVEAIEGSKTVAVTDTAAALVAQGIDVLSFAVGEPDYQPPQVVLDAVKASMDDGTGTRYSALAGWPTLRDAIATKLREENGIEYSPKNEILVTCGAKQSLFQSMMALCRPGDEVLIPTPYWVSYPAITTLSGATPVYVHTKAEHDFRLDAETLEAAITLNTRLLILCNPSNPTGAVLREQHMEELAAVLRRHPHVYVITDEIYEKILYDGEVKSLASMDGMRDRCVVVNGFSKSYSMTGFRLGYMAASAPIIAAAAKVQSQNTTCASSMAQAAAVVALNDTPADFLPAAVDRFRAKKEAVLEGLRAIPGVVVPEPEGAFYVFFCLEDYIGKTTAEGQVLDDDVALCVYILEVGHVAIVPGSAFGKPNWARMSFATTVENVKTGTTRIREALAQLV